MSKKKKSSSKARPSLFKKCLLTEVKGNIKPYSAVAVIYALSLIASAVSARFFPSAIKIAYTALYISIIALFAVSAIVPIRRAYLDVSREPIFGTPPPTAKELTFAKLVSVFIFTIASALLHALADGTLTFIGELSYKGYGKSLASVSILLFSLVFYLTSVIVTSVSDYKKNSTEKPKKLRRRIVMDGILLYAIGLSVLMFVMLCFSSVPIEDGSLDISGIAPGLLPSLPSGEVTEGESLFNPDIALPLSLIYLFASAIRTVYLYFILKRRLKRAHKLN